MKSSDLTFDGGQVMARSYKVRYLNQYFHIKRTSFRLRVSSGLEISLAVLPLGQKGTASSTITKKRVVLEFQL